MVIVALIALLVALLLAAGTVLMDRRWQRIERQWLSDDDLRAMNTQKLEHNVIGANLPGNDPIDPGNPAPCL